MPRSRLLITVVAQGVSIFRNPFDYKVRSRNLSHARSI
ncbi:MAG: hypothetical protein OJF50_002106 [Nitrospira sp.]|nr:hypothetical protein [Nitrospira sp.]